MDSLTQWRISESVLPSYVPQITERQIAITILSISPEPSCKNAGRFLRTLYLTLLPTGMEPECWFHCLGPLPWHPLLPLTDILFHSLNPNHLSFVIKGGCKIHCHQTHSLRKFFSVSKCSVWQLTFACADSRDDFIKWYLGRLDSETI